MSSCLSINGMGSTRMRRSHCQCGDDLVAYWPICVDEMYTTLLKSTGGALSAGKDLSNVTSFNFVEKCGCLLAKRLRSPVVIPLRSLTGVVSVGTDIPAHIEAGSSVSTVLRLLPFSSWKRKMASRIVRSSYSSLINRMNRAGIPTYIDRQFGGGGFPVLASDAHNWNSFPSFARAWRIMLSHVRGLDAVFAHNRLCGAWSPLSDVRREGLFDLVIGPIREYGDWNKPEDQGEKSYLGDQLEGALARLEYLETQKLVKLSTYPSLPEIASKVKMEIERLNKLVPSNRLADKVRKMTAGIDRKFTNFKESYSYVPSFIGSVLCDRLVTSVYPKVGFGDRCGILDGANEGEKELFSFEGIASNAKEL